MSPFFFFHRAVEHFRNMMNLSHFSNRIKAKCSWSVQMMVQVVGSDGCYSLGDALRDLYAKHLLRKYFILLTADTVTNANLKKILDAHV